MSDDTPRALTRAQLPEHFTAESVGRLPVRVLRALRGPNDVLTAEEQAEFDAAVNAMLKPIFDKARESMLPDGLDKALAPLSEQSRAIAKRFQERLVEQTAVAQSLRTKPDVPYGTKASLRPNETTGREETGDDLVGGVERDTAVLQVMKELAKQGQTQVQLLRESNLRRTRELFFATVVSIAVVVAGVAPLVDASSEARWWIAGWTAAICIASVVAYWLVRQRQSSTKPRDGESPSTVDAGSTPAI